MNLEDVIIWIWRTIINKLHAHSLVTGAFDDWSWQQNDSLSSTQLNRLLYSEHLTIFTGHPLKDFMGKWWKIPPGNSGDFTGPWILIADGHIAWQCTCRQPWPKHFSHFFGLVSKHQASQIQSFEANIFFHLSQSYLVELWIFWMIFHRCSTTLNWSTNKPTKLVHFIRIHQRSIWVNWLSTLFKYPKRWITNWSMIYNPCYIYIYVIYIIYI